MRVPGHDDVGEQGQGSRDRAEFLHRAPVLCGDHAVVDGALEAVHGLALVQEVEDFRPEHRIAKVIAEIEGADELPQTIAGFVDGVADSGRTERSSASVAGYQPCFTEAPSRSNPSQPRAMARRETASTTRGRKAGGSYRSKARGCRARPTGECATGNVAPVQPPKLCRRS